MSDYSSDLVKQICALLSVKVYVDPQTDLLFHHRYLKYPPKPDLLTTRKSINDYLLRTLSLWTYRFLFFSWFTAELWKIVYRNSLEFWNVIPDRVMTFEGPQEPHKCE